MCIKRVNGGYFPVICHSYVASFFNFIVEVEIVETLTNGKGGSGGCGGCEKSGGTMTNKVVPLEERVFAVFPVVKQTAYGTRTRFKVLAAVGDQRGHVGLGIKCYKGDSLPCKN